MIGLSICSATGSALEIALCASRPQPKLGNPTILSFVFYLTKFFSIALRFLAKALHYVR